MEDPAGYLFRTAMNVFRGRYRRALLAVRRVAFAVERDDAFEQVEARDMVVRAVGSLPRDQRAALIVTSLLGYSSEEAGRILGIRPSPGGAGAPPPRAALREAIGDER
jgi:DNA-directed RNA polymerase specialized sigma24 family protein